MTGRRDWRGWVGSLELGEGEFRFLVFCFNFFSASLSSHLSHFISIPIDT